MANVIRLKRASGSDPVASDLVSGEPAVRTDTGELFFKKDDGSVAKVSGAGGGPDFKYLALRNAANNGAASYPNADFTLVTSGTTSAITPTAANTLLVSVNGVIQKPNTGTSTPSSGFALSGSTIKFGANISAAPDFILYQESGGIGEPSDETVSEAKLKVSNSPVNGYFLSAQSGNTGGLTWAAPVATSCTGNSATATALATARTINGTSFDGTANITVTAAAGTLTGNTLNSSVVTSSLTSLGDLTSLTVTGDLVVDTSTLKVDSSNNRVGIGTTSPTKTLHIHGDTGNELPVYWIRGGSSVGGYLYSDGGGSGIVGGDGILANTGMYLVTDTRIDFRVNGSERMRINSNGAVMVGGTLQASTNGGLNAEVTDSGNERVPLSLINQGTANGSGVIISHRGKDDAGNQQDYNYIRMVADDTSSGSEDGSIRFWTLGGGTLGERLRIDSSGNVGIGVTSPTHPLDVHTSGTEVARFQGANNARLKLRNATNNIFLAYTDSGDAFQLGTNGQNVRVHITSDGNVGIGTTSPSTKLHVNGTVTATAYAGDGSALTGISAGATGGGSDEIFYENSQTITTDYTITSGKNAMSAGPITINNGVSVTVPSGSTYTIV